VSSSGGDRAVLSKSKTGSPAIRGGELSVPSFRVLGRSSFSARRGWRSPGCWHPARRVQGKAAGRRHSMDFSSEKCGRSFRLHEWHAVMVSTIQQNMIVWSRHACKSFLSQRTHYGIWDVPQNGRAMNRTFQRCSKARSPRYIGAGFSPTGSIVIRVVVACGPRFRRRVIFD